MNTESAVADQSRRPSRIRFLTMEEIIAEYPPGSARRQFWEEERDLRKSLNESGEFWADAVARLKKNKQYAEAADLARQAMPVPAAYRELQICLRHLFRQRKQDGGNLEPLVRELYATAVAGAALCTPPTVTLTRPMHQDPRLNTYPGFNAARIFHRLAAKHGLPLDYATVGYAKVSLLNQTDRKWIAELWGEPPQHQDPFELYRPIWEAARELFTCQMEAERGESQAEWRALLGRPAQPTMTEKPMIRIAAGRKALPPPRRRWWWPFG